MISRKLNTTIFNNRQLFTTVYVTTVTTSSERLNANSSTTKDEAIMLGTGTV